MIKTLWMCLFLFAICLTSPASAQYYEGGAYYEVWYDVETKLCLSKGTMVDRGEQPVGWNGLLMDRENAALIYYRKDWEEYRDRTVSIAIEFSNGVQLAGRAMLEDGALSFTPGTTRERDGLIRSWADSASMTIHTSQGAEFGFRLNGTARAVAGLAACWRDNFASRGDPFGEFPSPHQASDPF